MRSIDSLAFICSADKKTAVREEARRSLLTFGEIFIFFDVVDYFFLIFPWLLFKGVRDRKLWNVCDHPTTMND